MNTVIIEGRLSSEPRERQLPSGSLLRSYEVSTVDAGVTRSVPVAWLEPRRPPRLREGDRVLVVGAVRRRFFRAGGAVASRTEVEAEVVARLDSTRARRARAEAVSRLAPGNRAEETESGSGQR